MLFSQADRRETTVTMAGTNMSSVRALEKNRGSQTSQYGRCVSPDIAAAAGNEDTKGAIRTAPPRKAPTRRSVSKRAGASLNRRTQEAATRASVQFVTKSARTTEGGHKPPSWAKRWAGSA